MPAIRCPIEDCEYQTPDVESVVAAALITAHAISHQASAHVEKVKRPTISSAGTTQDWQYFKSRWNDYVRATRLRGADKVIQLLECCDDQLRKDLTRNAGGTLSGKTEGEVLAAIRGLAVREENAMVARVTLHNMRQERDEPIRARLTSVCKFQRKCANCDADVDYTEAMLRDVLCRGLEDTEIQMDLLGDGHDIRASLNIRRNQGGGEEIGSSTTIATSDGRDDQQLISEAEETIPTCRTRQEPRSLHILWHQGPWKKPSN